MGLYRDEAGKVIEVDDRFAEARGYTPLSSLDENAMYQARGLEARGTERGVVGGINAAATGALSGLTLGGSDYLLGKVLPDGERERLLAEMAAHPYLRAGGEIAGTLAAAMATGGSSLARTPTGYLAQAANRGVESALAAGGIRGTAKAIGVMGAEGAAASAGQYIGHASLQDKEVTAEGLTGALGTGFAFGGVGGGAALGVVNGVMAGRRLYSRVMGGRKAAEAAESSWTIAAQESLEADMTTARTAEAKLESIRVAKMEALRGRNEARSAAQEASLDAQGARVAKPAPEDVPLTGPADFGAQVDGLELRAPGDALTSAPPRPHPMPEPLPARPAPEGAPVTDPADLLELRTQAAPVRLPKGQRGVKRAAEQPDDAALAIGGVQVTRDGRQLMHDGKVIDSTAAEGLARAQMPDGFGLGTMNPRTPFKIGTGVPAHADIAPNSLHVVRPSDLVKRGIIGNELKDGGVKAITKAWDEGKKLPPIDINVTPQGKLYVEDGNHRLMAAAANDRPIAVNFKKVGDDFKPQAGATDLEAQLAGTKAKLDEGASIKDIHGDPSKPARKFNEDDPLDLDDIGIEMLGEMRRGGRTKEGLLKTAADLRVARQQALSEIRYKATEDLLGSAVAKQEQILSDLMDEFHAARRDFEGLAARVDDAAPAREVTGRASPGQRKAIEILDDAHEEALLRAKHAADPQEAGRAITEAEELENLLEEMAGAGSLSDGVPLYDARRAMESKPLSRFADPQKTGGSPRAKQWADDLVSEAAKVARYEKASAALADELADVAHPISAEKSKALRQAERDAEHKMYDRATRATDDAADGIHPKVSAAKAAKKAQIEAQKKLDELNAQHQEAAHDFSTASKKVSEGEKAKKGALRDDAKLARTGTQAGGVGAQDVGGLLEIIDIPGMPKPSDLPIVGPLLGAYLTFRTIKKAMTRGMGKVPATADARVAALASQTRDRVARAVDRSIGALERGAKGMTRVMPPVAGVLAHRIYDDGGEDPKKGASIQDLAAARMRELNAYVHTPGAIERDVRRQLAEVTDPDLIAAAEAQRRAQMEFLLKVSPKMPEPNLLNPIKYRPAPAQAMSFARSMDAVGDPAGVFERLAHEQAMISLEAAEALRSVYPRIFSEAGMRLMERAQEGGLKVPMRMRVQLSLLYKVPLDSALDPDNLKITQSVYERKTPMPPPGMQGAPTTPSIANPVNLSQGLTPAADRR